MAMPDIPIPAELAVEAEPLSDDELARYFDVHEAFTSASGLPEHMRPQPSETEAGRWRIESDDAAEWALRKLAMARDEAARLREQADEWAARIEHWFVQAAREHVRTEAFMRERLEDYGLRRRDAGGAATLNLPSGTIKTTSSQPAVEVVDDATLALVLETALGEPPRALSDEDAASYRAWREAWDKLVADSDEPVELVKRTPKVYVGPLRKLVRVAELPTGQTRWVLSLSCEHEQIITTDDDDMGVELGDELPCSQCPGDPIDGAALSTLIAVEQQQLTELVAVGPDDEPVPGAGVKPGGVTATVKP